MTKRENLLWQIIIVVAFLAIAYNGYLLYSLNSNSKLLWNNYLNEEVGTDKSLQKKVQKSGFLPQALFSLSDQDHDIKVLLL